VRGSSACCCLGVLLVRSRQLAGAHTARQTALLGDDLRLPYGAGTDVNQPASDDDDPMFDMVFHNGGPDVRAPSSPPARSNSIPPTGIFTGHGHSVGGGPLTIGDNTYFVRAPPERLKNACLRMLAY
jgi:hypothetical protein